MPWKRSDVRYRCVATPQCIGKEACAQAWPSSQPHHRRRLQAVSMQRVQSSLTWCQHVDGAAAAAAGMMPEDKEVFTPAEAFQRSSALFHNLTGRTSPDIVLFASCLWYGTP